MKALVACAFAGLLLAAAADAKKPDCTFRVHLEGNANDTAVFATHALSKFSGHEVFIEKTATISERDVTAFRSYRASDGTYGILIQLDDHGTIALETLSIENRGKSLFVFVNGRDIAELQIDSRIRDGRIYLASGLTERDIQMFSKCWPTIGQKKR